MGSELGLGVSRYGRPIAADPAEQRNLSHQPRVGDKPPSAPFQSALLVWGGAVGRTLKIS